MTDLTALEPARYDNIVILASEWKESEVESDARTILGFLMLEELLSTADAHPEVLVELMDQENVRCCAAARMCSSARSCSRTC